MFFGRNTNRGQFSNDFIKERGGDPEKIRDSQRKRNANVEIVDEIIAGFEDHRQSMRSGTGLENTADGCLHSSICGDTNRLYHQWPPKTSRTEEKGQGECR